MTTETVPMPVTRSEYDSLAAAVVALAARVAKLEEKKTEPAPAPAAPTKRFKGLLGLILLAPLLFVGCVGTRVKAAVCYYDEAGRGYCGEIEFERPPEMPGPPLAAPPPPKIVIEPEAPK